MEPDDTTDSVFLNLATSFTSVVVERTDDFESSDEEPLIAKTGHGFNTSDDEPLITKLGEGFQTSDDEPLILKAGNGNQHDSLIRDPNYSPSDDAADSEASSSPSTKHQLTILREKMRRKKKPDCNQTRSTRQVESASHKDHQSFLNNVRHHTNRLDNLLSANGLSRQDVSPDGNCFFAASIVHLETTSQTELRNSLCSFLEDNFGAYMPFMGHRDGEDENERYLRFFYNVQELRSPGKWNNDAADVLPQVLADWSQRVVRIYSSNLFASVLDIVPTGMSNFEAQQTTNPIYLAFINCSPQHYDACIKDTNRAVHQSDPPATTNTALNQQAAITTELNQPSAINTDHNQPSAINTERSQPSTINTEHSQPSAVNTEQIQPSAINAGQIQPSAVNTEQIQPASPNQPPNLDQDNGEHEVTPRKQGPFYTPPKKVLVRKREAKPKLWKKNVRKSLHLQGKEYVSQTGKIIPAKTLKPVDCSCKYKCNSAIRDDQRQQLFDMFYALKDYNRQKDFVCSNVEQKNTITVMNDKGEPVKKRRQTCRTYSFKIEGQIVRVCKKFFLATLAVGETYVDHALKNSENGTYCNQDKRGKTRPHNKTSDEAVSFAMAHIASFPVLESHYSRKDTLRMYLPSDLTLKKMYELYVQRCKEQGFKESSLKKYRQIFNENFNISFHTPKKDQCATCTTYHMKLQQGLASEEEKESFKEHMDRKKRAREEKEKDKEEAKHDPSKHVVTMDLQAVLQAPCGMVSQLYYKRKLSIYNFTIYSLADGKGTCFTWDETEGKRGSCEIATCVYIYLSSLPKCVEEVTLFSDCCAGQNRNQYMATALIHAVNKIDNIRIITHKYLETGHTQMECDSMHAAITFAKKHTPIYTPSGWDIILRMARRGRPYVVIPIKHSDILDFKSLASSAVRNTKTDLTGRRVQWLNIKCLKFLKDQSEMMFFKYSFDQEDFQVLKLVGSSKRGKAVPLSSAIPCCYACKLPVSSAKKQDLLSLCNSGIIPTEHHKFYMDLRAAQSSKDKLPEPDRNEQDYDTE